VTYADEVKRILLGYREYGSISVESFAGVMMEGVTIPVEAVLIDQEDNTLLPEIPIPMVAEVV
jgi:hypothetical protein